MQARMCQGDAARSRHHQVFRREIDRLCLLSIDRKIRATRYGGLRLANWMSSQIRHRIDTLAPGDVTEARQTQIENGGGHVFGGSGGPSLVRRVAIVGARCGKGSAKWTLPFTTTEPASR